MTIEERHVTMLNMRLRLLRSSTQVTGKRVLFRMDGNVPIVHGRVDDGPHGRIARAAVDIEWLAQRGARVIILTHLGRPHGKHISAYSVNLLHVVFRI